MQSAVQFAHHCGYKVAVRSGGHSYTGSSSCNSHQCMQLDLRAMNKTSVTGNMIKAGPGITLGDFSTFTLKHLLSVPHGGCTGVGLGGHMQSSAWGFMSNSHGSGLDRVESFRMVLADGAIGIFSRGDANNTVYRSVLGSAPGSWGVVTEYTFNGVRDIEVPHTRMLTTRLTWSREQFLKSFRHAQFIVMDQEEKNLRDMKFIYVVSPRTAGTDYTVIITIVALWTGIDSGRMTDEWHQRYWQPFKELERVPFSSFDIPLDLSGATWKLATLFENHDDRYAVQAFHSDHWWSDEFIELIADELEERVALVPDIYPSFQFLPLGQHTQWARNSGMNALTWRDARAYVDDWMFVKNESRYSEAVERMVGFREKTRNFWQYRDGSDRSTWMSPSTTYPNATDLRIPSVAKQFFPNQTQFHELQLLKAELDPIDVFSNKGTIPLPGDVHGMLV